MGRTGLAKGLDAGPPKDLRICMTASSARARMPRLAPALAAALVVGVVTGAPIAHASHCSEVNWIATSDVHPYIYLVYWFGLPFEWSDDEELPSAVVVRLEIYTEANSIESLQLGGISILGEPAICQTSEEPDALIHTETLVVPNELSDLDLLSFDADGDGVPDFAEPVLCDVENPFLASDGACEGNDYAPTTADGVLRDLGLG